MKNLLLLTTLLATSSLSAAQIVILPDGREVKLNDDFTWQYITPNSTAKMESSTTNMAAIPLVNDNVTTTVRVNTKKPTMQLSKSGVDVLIGSARYHDGELVLPTTITNQGAQAVIRVELEVEVLDASGTLLTKQNITIWQSIKRMAETYLRPKQVQQGKAIKLALPSFQQYQFSAKVIGVETR